MKALVRLTSLATLIVLLVTVTFACQQRIKATSRYKTQLESAQRNFAQDNTKWNGRQGPMGLSSRDSATGQNRCNRGRQTEGLEAPSPYDAVIVKPVSDNQNRSPRLTSANRNRLLVFEGE